MAYPTRSSVIDFRSKIRPLKTTQILTELDKLTSNTNAKTQRHSLFANRSFANSSAKSSPHAIQSNKSLSARSSPYSIQPNKSAARRQTIQPKLAGIGSNLDDSFSSIPDVNNTLLCDPFESKKSVLSSPAYQSFFNPFDSSKTSFPDLEPIISESFVKEVEDDNDFVFEKPLMPEFIETDTFKFDPPELRGPTQLNLPDEPSTDSESVLSDFLGNDEQ